MKTLLLHVIAICAAVLPVTQAQAVEPAGKKYGDFKPGDKFTLKVTTVTEIGKRPSNFPVFKEGQSVKFTIGPKGQLIGPKFTINFEPEGTSANENYYDNATPSTQTLVHQAVVRTKGVPPKAYFVNLALREQKGFSVFQGTYLFGK